MNRFTGWVTAAAVLLEETSSEREGLHYKDITESVVNSGLSGLTELGGKTPEETLSRDMRAKPKIFARMDHEYPDEGYEKGRYIVYRDVAQRDPDIIEARKQYTAIKNERVINK